MAKALGVQREQIAFAIDAPKLVPDPKLGIASVMPEFGKERLVPRFDKDLAYATSDEAIFYEHASRSQDVTMEIMVPLTEETSGYAEEFVGILSSLSWSQRSPSQPVPATEEIALRRRIRQLLVLLKGNDVWVYETEVIRRLPERYTVAPPDEPHTMEFRQVIAFGPPGEYGETSLRVPVDNGQPYILPGRDFAKRQEN